RRQLLDRLRRTNGQTLSSLCAGIPATRQAVSQQLDVLEAANLLSTVRRGRDKLHFINPVPLHDIAERWIAQFERADLDGLHNLKRHLEGGHTMTTATDTTTVIYVTYIATTPERVWEALTDPEMTAKYWQHRNVSGWKVGDSWAHAHLDDDDADGGGTILEI